VPLPMSSPRVGHEVGEIQKLVTLDGWKTCFCMPAAVYAASYVDMLRRSLFVSNKVTTSWGCESSHSPTVER